MKGGKPAPRVSPSAQRPAPKGSHMAPSDAKGGNSQPPKPHPGSTPTAKTTKQVPAKKAKATTSDVDYVVQPGMGYQSS